jgi:hypothetical protein
VSTPVFDAAFSAASTFAHSGLILRGKDALQLRPS